MKKLLSLLGVFIFIGCLQSYASKREIYMDFYKSGHVDKNTTVHRSPMRIPIDVYYDEELRLIEISGNEDMSIQIYLCDENGNTINCSPSINTILIVGDITRQSLAEIWNSEKALNLYYLQQNTLSDKSHCKTCKYFIDCRQKMGGVCWKEVISAYGTENWDFPDPSCPFAPDPYHDVYIK